MRRVVLTVLFASVVTLIQAQPRRAAPSLLIRNISLIDGTGGPLRAGVNVFTRDGRIVSVGSDAPDAELAIDGRGLFLLPGLIDAHVHLSGDSWNGQVEMLGRMLRGGVTSVFDVAGDDRSVSNLARAAIAGEIESPTITYASLFAGPEFMSDPRLIASSVGFRAGDAPWAREIRPETDMVRAVAEARGAGATWIKLYAALDGATVRKIGDEARKQQVSLIAHATVFPARPSDLVAAGVKILAHAAYLVWEGMPPSAEFQKRARGDFASVPADGPVITQLLQSMKDHDVALNPTLWIFAEGSGKDDLSGVRTPWMNTVTKRAQDLGVTIAAGVDSLFAPRDPLPLLHREMEAMVNGARLTPLQAITSATRGAAHAMGIDGARGSVAAGKAADLLIVEGDPTVDIRNTRRIKFVIKDGRIVR
ncbi:MAG TPA: amidohydrolase family protein [Vicinamibacterales bacterium]|nr:amidohydrolase family protein [Vicinamibacterales bacterium]